MAMNQWFLDGFLKKILKFNAGKVLSMTTACAKI
jgi:hypothetical protein